MRELILLHEDLQTQHAYSYRFRLINIACDANFIFSVDRHIITVIEADSINHEPVTVDSIQIFAGQRYSFIVGVALVSVPCYLSGTCSSTQTSLLETTGFARSRTISSRSWLDLTAESTPPFCAMWVPRTKSRLLHTSPVPTY